ncbi:MAG: winged helix-turn-helix transcriptional regulator [Rhizobiales bacterium]|nr:winged helix-turn-helix transcriptional regulator [Hyphomicrobiales bacterium]
MKEGPDIALLGAMIGDPARANILIALMSGKALTASELAGEAGVTLQTTSSHLGKLEAAGLIRKRKQGRHRYFSLTNDEVGSVLEAMMGLAARQGHTRSRTGPKDPALRKARICYDHLAGEAGVQMFESMIRQDFIIEDSETVSLTEKGREFAVHFGVDMASITRTRRPVCKPCLDWSARRSHLAGSLGAACFDRFLKLGWIKRRESSRVIEFTRRGETLFKALFP